MREFRFGDDMFLVKVSRNIAKWELAQIVRTSWNSERFDVHGRVTPRIPSRRRYAYSQDINKQGRLQVGPCASHTHSSCIYTFPSYRYEHNTDIQRK